MAVPCSLPIKPQSAKCLSALLPKRRYMAERGGVVQASVYPYKAAKGRIMADNVSSPLKRGIAPHFLFS